MSQCYGPLAARYDALTGDVPYEALETWYETAFAHSGRAVHTVLDLCCGTGTLSLLLAEHGYEMICVDASEEMLSIGSVALRIISVSFVLAGFDIIAGSVCQAIGNPLYSLITSVCRQLVVLLPVAWLLSHTGVLTLVWLAFPIAELMSLTLSIIFLRKTLRMAEAAMASGKSAE